MKDPASSSPAERSARRWYQEPWPWFLIAAPAAAVVASIATAWLAFASDDGVVAQDYYRQGLRVNERIRGAAPDPAPQLGAAVRIGSDGEVRVRITGLAESPRNPRVRIAHRAAPREQIVRLEADAMGDYVGTLRERVSGRWTVTLESDGWRLPTTTVADGQSEAFVGTAERS